MTCYSPSSCESVSASASESESLSHPPRRLRMFQDLQECYVLNNCQFYAYGNDGSDKDIEQKSNTPPTFRVGRVPEVPVAEAVRAGAAVAGLLRAAARARGVSPQPRLLLAAVPQVVIILGDVIHVGGDREDLQQQHHHYHRH